MSDPPAGPDTGPQPAPRPETGVPRWVKVSGIVVAALVLLVVVLAVIGDHGPGRHGGDGLTPAEVEAQGNEAGDGDHDPADWDHG